jgi:alkylhydroperoxidase family enzyme
MTMAARGAVGRDPAHTSQMDDPHATALEALRAAVLDGPAVTEAAARSAAASGGPLPEPMGAYVAKVREQSYRVGDEDISGLRASGLDEEQIFELTVAAALGAALHRLDVGLCAVREGTP